MQAGLAGKAERAFMNTAERLKIEKKEGIGIVKLERPDSLNILDTSALENLRNSLTDLGKDSQVRVLIITGSRHFCAGADIRELKDKDAGQARIFAELGHSLCDLIEDMEKPVIAAVTGYALGAGCEIALACDIRIASEKAKFAQPEVNLGIIPGFGGTQRLARLIGIGRAKEMILTGRVVDAHTAESIGLVNKVVKDEVLIREAEETTRLLAKKSPLALKLAKRLINQNHGIREGLDRGIELFADCFTSEDHREGIKAFLEKRTPKFRGA
jgi:enoyl-CoA hydratase